MPFLGKKEKEEERPLSDKEMVTKFLGKIFLPIFFSIVSILVFGPNTITIVVAVIGGIFAVKGGIEVLFSNNKSGALYNPNSKEEEEKDWDNKIIDRIRNILKTPIKGTGKSEQPRENFKKYEKLYLPSGKIEEVIKAVKGLQSGDIKSSSLSDMSCLTNIKQVLSR
ncbi:MAG: hypothetical protein ACEY3B_05930 [Wolbachia sp.]